MWPWQWLWQWQWQWLWLWLRLGLGMDCIESVDLIGEDYRYHKGEDDGQDLGIGHHVDVYWIE